MTAHVLFVYSSIFRYGLHIYIYKLYTNSQISFNSFDAQFFFSCLYQLVNHFQNVVATMLWVELKFVYIFAMKSITKRSSDRDTVGEGTVRDVAEK